MQGGTNLMPKAGFKSITVSENIYDKFHARFEKKKEALAMRGISSFSGYVTFVLSENLKKGDM